MSEREKIVRLDGWKVDLRVDEDNHLSVYIENEDGSEVHECQSDQGDEKVWAERFTTEQIELDYNHETCT